MAEWSLPREDLCRRLHPAAGAPRPEAFRPPPHERARGGWSAVRVRLRRLADLQFGSIWRDLEALLPAVDGTLADVGAGSQPFRDLIAPSVRYVAVDVDEAERQFGYRTPETRYFRGAVLPLEDREAGTVLCTETLEHVPGVALFLAELRRVLAPGGLLILTIPFAARWHFIPQDYWRFTPAGLEQVLTAAGFRDVRIYARGGALAVACYKVLGFVLWMLAGGGRRALAALPYRLAGIAASPAAVVAVALGNVALRVERSGEDTLGYTVLAC